MTTWLAMLAIGYVMPADSGIGQWFSNHTAEVFGALVVIVVQDVLHLREDGK